MKNRTIAFIGGGNMASSLVGGLISGGWASGHIRVADPQPDRLTELARRFGVQTTAVNLEAATGAEVVVLAVKPQVVAPVARELGSTLREQGSLVMSIAAGVRAADICRWLGYAAPLVRAMPNTPALVGSGATGVHAEPAVSSEQRDLAESILRSVGVVLWVGEERLLDAVTALSGSGPAYLFLLLEVLEEAGTELGLDPRTARLLTLETAFGAAKLALASAEPAATLRARVTSPGGTTERAITRLEEGGIRGLFREALQAACQRAVELGDRLGES
jgi:pyrroline-5-carboxylate reductase